MKEAEKTNVEKRSYSCIFHGLERIIFNPILIDEIPGSMLQDQYKTVSLKKQQEK